MLCTAASLALVLTIYGRWLTRKQSAATARVVPQRKSEAGVRAATPVLFTPTPFCSLFGSAGGGLWGGGGGTRSEVEEAVCIAPWTPPSRPEDALDEVVEAEEAAAWRAEFCLPPLELVEELVAVMGAMSECGEDSIQPRPACTTPMLTLPATTSNPYTLSTKRDRRMWRACGMKLQCSNVSGASAGRARMAATPTKAAMVASTARWYRIWWRRTLKRYL